MQLYTWTDIIIGKVVVIVNCICLIIGRFDYEKNGIVVFRKKNKSSKLTKYCGRGVINAPYTAVAEFIKDIESTFVWDKYVVVSCVTIKEHYVFYILYRRQNT